MQKLLIIGAGILQVPAIQKAKELNLYVGVVDLSPMAPGICFADEFFQVSTNDIDGIIKIAKEFNPDGVMTLATDMPMRSVAAVVDHFGLNGISPQVAFNATDKIAMIKCFFDNNVPAPWFFAVSSRIEFESLLKKINPPFILKPNDSSGSRGVILIDKMNKAISGFEYSMSFSKSGFVLVEEFLLGPEVSVEVITINGKSSVLAVTDKLTTGPPYFVEMGHSQPSMLPAETVEKIIEISKNAVKAVGIDNSPSHVELIITESGPKLVELGARLGGDCITTYLVPLSTGIDMVKASVKLSLGEIPEIKKMFDKGAAIRYIKSDTGLLKEITGLENATNTSGVKHVEIVKQIGDTIDPIHGSGDRIGYVICQSDTPSEAKSLCEEVIKKITVVVS
jgi:biotin carboxylase